MGFSIYFFELAQIEGAGVLALQVVHSCLQQP